MCRCADCICMLRLCFCRAFSILQYRNILLYLLTVQSEHSVLSKYIYLPAGNGKEIFINTAINWISMLLQFVPPNLNCYCQPPQNASLNLCMAQQASTIMNQQNWSFILQPKTSKSFARLQWVQWKLLEGSVRLRFIFTHSIISSNIICLSVFIRTN